METFGYEGDIMNSYVTDTNGLIRYLADSVLGKMTVDS